MEEDSAAYRAAQLESELEEARSCLEDKERDLMKAAEFGKRLLDSNQDLNNHMEQLSRECTEKIEVCVCVGCCQKLSPFAKRCPGGCYGAEICAILLLLRCSFTWYPFFAKVEIFRIWPKTMDYNKAF